MSATHLFRERDTDDEVTAQSFGLGDAANYSARIPRGAIWGASNGTKDKSTVNIGTVFEGPETGVSGRPTVGARNWMTRDLLGAGGEQEEFDLRNYAPGAPENVADAPHRLMIFPSVPCWPKGAFVLLRNVANVQRHLRG